MFRTANKEINFSKREESIIVAGAPRGIAIIVYRSDDFWNRWRRNNFPAKYIDIVQFIIARELRAIDGNRFNRTVRESVQINRERFTPATCASYILHEWEKRGFLRLKIIRVIRNYLARPCARKDEPVRLFSSSLRIRDRQPALARDKTESFGKQLTNYIIISFCTDPEFIRLGWNTRSSAPGIIGHPPRRRIGPARFLGSGIVAIIR